MSRSHSVSLTSGGSLVGPLGLGRPELWPAPGYDGGGAAGDAAAGAAVFPSPSPVTRGLGRREGREPGSSPPQGHINNKYFIWSLKLDIKSKP